MKRRKDFALNATEKADAREALLLLEGSGVTLAMAARIALRIQPEQSAVVDRLVSELVDLFLKDRLRKAKRSRTYDFYEGKLIPFSHSFEDVMVSTVTAKTLSNWFNGLESSAGGKAAYWRAIRAMFRWAAKTNHIAKDPTQEYMGPGSAPRTEVDFLSVEDAQQIMANAGHHRAAAALQLFAGIRPEEVASLSKPVLKWQHINFSSRTIRVPSEVAKSGQARVLETGLPRNLWLWLESIPAAERTGSICSIKGSSLSRFLQRAGRFVGAREERLKPWPFDGLRHSFATYHVAWRNKPGMTSLLLGHEVGEAMLHRHYRGLTDKASAVAYFEIAP